MPRSLQTLLVISHVLLTAAKPIGLEQLLHPPSQAENVPAQVERRIVIGGPGATPTIGPHNTAFGAFGPHGYLGSIQPNGDPGTDGKGGQIDTSGNTYQPPVFCYGSGCALSAIAYLGIMGTIAGVNFLKKEFSFHNVGDGWPAYESLSPADTYTATTLWSIRTFRTPDCGSDDTLGALGRDPLGKGISRKPFMMSQITSTDMYYHDKKPFQNFMVNSKHGYTVKSVATFASNTTANQPYLFLYTNPAGNISLVHKKVADGSMQWTTNPKFNANEGYQDALAQYNGQGVPFGNVDQNGKPAPVSGTWNCYVAADYSDFQGFSVIYLADKNSGTRGTDMTLPPDWKPNEPIKYANTAPVKKAGTTITDMGGSEITYLTNDVTQVAGYGKPQAAGWGSKLRRRLYEYLFS